MRKTFTLEELKIIFESMFQNAQIRSAFDCDPIDCCVNKKCIDCFMEKFKANIPVIYN